MKVKATKKFENIIDLTIGKTRTEGEIFEVTEARAKKLIDAGVAVEYIEPAKPKETKKPKKTTKKK